MIGPYAFYYCSVDVVFPDSLIMIEEGAFEGCTGLESVVLPEGIVSIGDEAFLGAYLKDIYLPDSIEYIGNYAFAFSDLQKISIPDKAVYIGDMCFAKSDLELFGVRDEEVNMKETQNMQVWDKYFNGTVEPTIGYKAFWRAGTGAMTIPNGIIKIKKEAFEQSRITEITIPETVTSIGARAFLDCWYLNDITIPESVTVIGDGAFSACGVEKIAIPKNVEEIEGNPFKPCIWEFEIAVDSGNERFEVKDGVLFDKKEKRLITALVKEKYEVPAGTEIIEDRAFYDCSVLEVTIPEGVTTIGAKAFSYCYPLTEITIPEGVTTIGAEAFSYCHDLTKITIPESVTAIGADALSDCDASLTAAIVQGSYAERYCIENGVSFVYQDKD